MIVIRVNGGSRIPPCICISLRATVCDLLLQIERRLGIKTTVSSPFWLSPVIQSDLRVSFAGNILDQYDQTLEDVDLYDHATILLLRSQTGGGKFVSLLSKCSNCPSANDCDFDNPESSNMLCNQKILKKLAEEMMDIYEEFGRLFGFEHEMETIRKNSESDNVRLTDVLHRQYHVKQQNLTWTDIRKTANKHNKKLAKAIDRAISCVSM